MTATDSPELAAMHAAYDSRERLEGCEFPHLNRQVGVSASQPFHHYGLGAEYVDVHRETAVINTATFGTCYPVETAAQQIRTFTESTISDLDKLIVELTAHRDRLTAELKTLAPHSPNPADVKEPSND